MLIKKHHPLSHLGFQRQDPSPHLAAYIDCYWTITRETALCSTRHETMFPEGGLGVIFNYGDPILLNKTPIYSPSFFDGTTTTGTTVDFDGAINAFAIRFKTGGAFPFLQSPLREVVNQIEGLESEPLLLSSIKHPKSHSFQHRIQIAEQHLYEMLASSKEIPPLALFAKIRKQSKLQTNVSSLSRSLGVSKRQLERLFLKYVGITPIKYLRLQRIEAARDLLKQNSHLSCADIAFELGFYDQSHFIREFRIVTNMTPKAYQNRRRST